MTRVAGSSQYLNAAVLANRKGLAAQTPTILNSGGSVSSTSLLDVGRRISAGNGIGLSSSARALNQQFLSNTSTFNELLSLGAGVDGTVEGAQTQILALRARLPESQVMGSLLEEAVENEENVEAGSEVDIEA